MNTFFIHVFFFFCLLLSLSLVFFLPSQGHCLGVTLRIRWEIEHSVSPMTHHLGDRAIDQSSSLSRLHFAIAHICSSDDGIASPRHGIWSAFYFDYSGSNRFPCHLVHAGFYEQQRLDGLDDAGGNSRLHRPNSVPEVEVSSAAHRQARPPAELFRAAWILMSVCCFLKFE